jgi:hypothetical protein
MKDVLLSQRNLRFTDGNYCGKIEIGVHEDYGVVRHNAAQSGRHAVSEKCSAYSYPEEGDTRSSLMVRHIYDSTRRHKPGNSQSAYNNCHK